eukprot:CAMPEP_0183342712 /NCGR_PEP_ID=MMETSP0164_2-20130417/8774_1 /TAXON_ID=221442 /ORGANISM="Coccolithus pelagicus ssp braarudi, Strain PLY182g" /LENGTH=262 /DNA_ID=CAMNT_0025513381 /DNA_START=1 /DNA_END=786 /DNA_ORIENTATION=-
MKHSLRGVGRRAALVHLPALLLPGLHVPSRPACAGIWNFGEIQAPGTCEGIALGSPELIGSGSSGAVFAADASTRIRSRVGGVPSRVAMKVSWGGAAAESVQNERRILERLASHAVPGVETVLASCSYPGADHQRTVLILSPLVVAPVVRVDELKPSVQPRAVDDLATTLVLMLSAGVATADVQLLADGSSGEPLLVDMTEARILESPPTFLDLALANGFISEIRALIPQSQAARFEVAISRELQAARLEPLLLEALCDGLG